MIISKIAFALFIFYTLYIIFKLLLVQFIQYILVRYGKYNYNLKRIKDTTYHVHTLDCFDLTFIKSKELAIKADYSYSIVKKGRILRDDIKERILVIAIDQSMNDLQLKETEKIEKQKREETLIKIIQTYEEEKNVSGRLSLTKIKK